MIDKQRASLTLLAPVLNSVCILVYKDAVLIWYKNIVVDSMKLWKNSEVIGQTPPDLGLHYLSRRNNATTSALKGLNQRFWQNIFNNDTQIDVAGSVECSSGIFLKMQV